MAGLAGAMTFAQAASQKDVITPAGYAYKPNFSEYYPPESRDAGEQGMVKVRICYDVKGRVQTADIDESSGFERLDQAALRASRDVVVKPGTVNRIAQEGCVIVPAKFSLLGEGQHSKGSASGSGQQNKTPTAELTYMPDIGRIYPSESRKKGEEGTAIVVVCYNTKGKVISSELYSSSGFAKLDEAAVRAGRKFRLKPPKLDGVAQEGCGAIPLKFSQDR
jgi:TonB family protein